MKLDEYRKNLEKSGKTAPSSESSHMTLAEYNNLVNKKQTHKKSKYGAKKKEVDGITFDSTWEADRYIELKCLERAGKVNNLKLQVKYPFETNGVLIANYIADFVYKDEKGIEIVEDAKGVKTDVYKLKRKMMKAYYNIEIFESYRS